MMLPTQNEVLEAITKTEKLMPAPRTLGRALMLLRDPDSGLNDIAELITRDSALAADVLRCANSAFFGRKTRVGAVSEAVQVIGFRETIRLVSLVAIHSTTNRDLGSYGIAADAYWTESLYNGLFFDALAKRTNGVDAGEAYTAGLLRYIGRLAINQALHDVGGGVFWNVELPLPEWERENVGITQAEIGADLLRKWKFPDSIVLAVELQDSVMLSDAVTSPAIIPAMNFLAQILPAGHAVPTEAAPAPAPALGAMEHPFAIEQGLNEDVIGEVHSEAHTAFLAIRETLYR
jgi:HD-like signal output (HDOD) protein